MKKTLVIFVLSVAAAAAMMTSCEKWLDVKSNQEIFEDDAFANTKGYRSALIGIYKEVASPALWGQELTWGLKSTLAWNYTKGTAVVKYRQPLNYFVYTDNSTKTVLEQVWGAAYKAVANINNLLQAIEDEDPDDFEFAFEKNLIIGEALGLRALIHFEMLQLFAPAPVTGFDGVAIPYVTTYPEVQPVHLPMAKVFELIIKDLNDSQKLLAEVDLKEFRDEESVWMSGATRMDNMLYFLFWNVGSYHADGSIRLNAQGDGFFANRGYRFNWWGCTGLISKVYSYKRDFVNAEKYADMLINDEWMNANQFTLYVMPTTAKTNPNAFDYKRLPEPILSFWNNNVCKNYATATGSTYNVASNYQYLFEGDTDTDVRYLYMHDPTLTATKRFYKVWNDTDPAYSANANNVKYSQPCLPVLELPEIFFIKAECQAEKGDIAGALATVKKIRDARGCTRVISADSKDTFMELLVNEVERDCIQRGTTFTFLKKLDWPKIYDGTPARFAVPEGWYVLPVPAETEIEFY